MTKLFKSCCVFFWFTPKATKYSLGCLSTYEAIKKLNKICVNNDNLTSSRTALPNYQDKIQLKWIWKLFVAYKIASIVLIVNIGLPAPSGVRKRKKKEFTYSFKNFRCIYVNYHVSNVHHASIFAYYWWSKKPFNWNT